MSQNGVKNVQFNFITKEISAILQIHALMSVMAVVQQGGVNSATLRVIMDLADVNRPCLLAESRVYQLTPCCDP